MIAGSFDYPDGVPDGTARSQGAGLTLPNRFDTVHPHVLGDRLDELRDNQALNRGSQIPT